MNKIMFLLVFILVSLLEQTDRKIQGNCFQESLNSNTAYSMRLFLWTQKQKKMVNTFFKSTPLF